jgi:hypothetical protein
MKAKANLQKQSNLPELSAETIIKHLIHLLHLPNHDFMTVAKKKCGLILLGVRREVVEELCRRNEPDKQAALEQVRQRVMRERREMEREYEQSK